MRRWRGVLAVACSAVVLSGCAMEDEQIRFVATYDEGVEPWGLQDAIDSSNMAKAVLEEQPEEIRAEFPELELEADILGIYEISDSVEGERKTATSQPSAGKEYEITARVLLTADAEVVLGQELDFLLELPTVIERGKKSSFAVAVFVNGVAAIKNEFAVTTSAHDLHLEYVPETYDVKRNGVTIESAVSDVLWNEDVNGQNQSLDYLTKPDQQLGVYEYILSCHVRAEILDTQQEDVAIQMAEPMSIRLEGISHQYSDSRDGSSAKLALNDCLRDNYFMEETILCEGTVYMAVEVFLPDWAREYAEQYGLVVTWYNYLDAPGCGIGVSLPTFPDNLGHVEASFENLRLTPMASGETKDTVGALTPYPVAPLSVWAKKENEVFALENLAMVEMPTEMTEEPRMGRQCVTQMLGGEVIEKLPASNRFYVLIGTDLICVEKDDVSE